MKKIVFAVLSVAMMISMVSCGGSVEGNSSENNPVSSSASQKEYSVTELGQKLFSEVTYEDDIQPLGENETDSIDFVTAYYVIEKEDILSAVLYAGSGATPEEICIVKAAQGKVEAVKTAMEGRLDILKTDFTDYNPEQMPKIDNAKVYVNDDYVVLCVSGDANKVKEILDNYFK